MDGAGEFVTLSVWRRERGCWGCCRLGVCTLLVEGELNIIGLSESKNVIEVNCYCVDCCFPCETSKEEFESRDLPIHSTIIPLKLSSMVRILVDIRYIAHLQRRTYTNRNTMTDKPKAERPSWNKEEYATKAKEKDQEAYEHAKAAEESLAKGHAPKKQSQYDDLPKPTELLKARTEDLGLTKNLNKTMLVTTTTAGKGPRGAGFYVS